MWSLASSLGPSLLLEEELGILGLAFSLAFKPYSQAQN